MWDTIASVSVSLLAGLLCVCGGGGHLACERVSPLAGLLEGHCILGEGALLSSAMGWDTTVSEAWVKVSTRLQCPTQQLS